MWGLVIPTQNHTYVRLTVRMAENSTLVAGDVLRCYQVLDSGRNMEPTQFTFHYQVLRTDGFETLQGAADYIGGRLGQFWDPGIPGFDRWGRWHARGSVLGRLTIERLQDGLVATHDIDMQATSNVSSMGHQLCWQAYLFTDTPGRSGRGYMYIPWAVVQWQEGRLRGPRTIGENFRQAWLSLTELVSPTTRYAMCVWSRVLSEPGKPFVSRVTNLTFQHGFGFNWYRRYSLSSNSGSIRGRAMSPHDGYQWQGDASHKRCG